MNSKNEDQYFYNINNEPKSSWLPKEFTERTLTKAIKKNIDRKRPSIDDVKLIDKTPLFSWVELNINELCNRRCVFCPRSGEYPNQNIHMDLKLVDSIASQLLELGFDGTVNISGTGEALLTKHLAGIVKKFGDRDIRIEIVTNGDKLTSPLIKELYCSGLTQLVVSMYDGPEQIKYFNNLFSECGIDEKLYSLRDRWYDEDKDYGLLYTNRTGALGEDLPDSEKRACYYPYYSLYIDWNGDILLCCQDSYNRTIILGNANTEPLWDIWTGQKFFEYRKTLKHGDRCNTPCSNCNANGMVFGANHAKSW